MLWIDPCTGIFLLGFGGMIKFHDFIFTCTKGYGLWILFITNYDHFFLTLFW